MRILAFDPGSATTGWALANVDARGGRSARTVIAACGADRGVRLTVHKHAESGLALEPFGPLPFLPELVAIETVSRVVPRDRFGAAMATGLVGAAEVGGMLAGAAVTLGLPVLRVAASDWRRAIAGSGTADDPVIKRALAVRLGDALPRTNEHARDAIGLALFAAERARRNAVLGHLVGCDTSLGRAGCGAACKHARGRS